MESGQNDFLQKEYWFMKMINNIGMWLVVLGLWFNLNVCLAEAPSEALLQADEDRVAAMLAVDVEGLRRVLSEQLNYAHSSGVVEDRDAFINALTTRKIQYVSYEYEKREFVFPMPGMALMQGVANLKIINVKGETELRLGFLAVWRLEKGEWKFLAWQSSRLPVIDAGVKK